MRSILLFFRFSLKSVVHNIVLRIFQNPSIIYYIVYILLQKGKVKSRLYLKKYNNKFPFLSVGDIKWPNFKLTLMFFPENSSSCKLYLQGIRKFLLSNFEDIFLKMELFLFFHFKNLYYSKFLNQGNAFWIIVFVT